MSERFPELEKQLADARAQLSAIDAALDAANAEPFISTDEEGWPTMTGDEERHARFVAAHSFRRHLWNAGWEIVKR